MECPEPGIYESVPFAEYCRWPCVNNSSLSPLLRSPAHYRAAMDNRVESSSDALRFGRFLHDSTLDPSVVDKYYAIEPDLTHGIDAKVPRATKLYRERYAAFLETIGDRELVSHEWYSATQQMLRSLYMHELSRAWLTMPGECEVSVIWDDAATGIRCKARFDRWCRGEPLVCDLKTTMDVTRFNESIGRFRYHRQAAFYVDAANTLTGKAHAFGLIAIEKERPFAVRAAYLDSGSIAAGRREYRRLLHELQRCMESNTWPGPDDPGAWTCPAWAAEQEEPVTLTIGGREVSV